MGELTSDQRKHEIAILAALVATVMAIVVGAHGLVITSAHRAIEADAQITAGKWAERLSVLPGVEAVLAGGALPRRSERYIYGLADEGLFRLKMFDREGRLRFDSELPADNKGRRADPGARSETAVRVLETGEVSYAAETGDGVSRPLHYAEAYHPLSLGGEKTGVIEAYFDQTRNMLAVHEMIGPGARLMAILAGLAFAVPAAGLMWSMRRINAARSALSYAASHDGLTGLVNRNAFRAEVERRAARMAGTRGVLRILFIDLDKFKDVNDTRGHASGDEVLRQVAARLRREAGEDCVVCRLGGDEFAVAESWPDGLCEEPTLARRIIAALSEPMEIRDDRVTIGASVGVAEFPKDATSTHDLLRAADYAVYEAKNMGRGLHCHYEPAMTRRRSERLAVEARLRQAVETGDFELHYQPLHRTINGGLYGYEALMRLSNERGEPISPGLFIPIAEETELIGPLGTMILERACEAATRWAGGHVVAVNLSPVQFRAGDLPGIVRAILEQTGLPPGRLELEVTESVLMRNTDHVALQFDALKEIGVSLALDDFGTGYSSLSYLWRFPFDKLKIDRSFVNSLNDGDTRSLRMFETVVALGQVLQLSITAEGVETRAQADLIDEMQVDSVQGYFFGRPMPLGALAGAAPDETAESKAATRS